VDGWLHGAALALALEPDAGAGSTFTGKGVPPGEGGGVERRSSADELCQ